MAQSDTSPGENAVALDYSGGDITSLARLRAIAVGGAGTIKVDMTGTGTGITFTVVAGQLLPVSIRKIYQTGSTATGLVGLY